MKVFIAYGYNDILQSAGPVGVAKTKSGAEKIIKEHDYILSKSAIAEYELQD